MPADGQPCGCCAGQTRQTPEAITNRPALSSVSYRAGRHSTFNASMLAALSNPAYPALAPLRTRDDTDFSIALLDAWAVALDILTFYQERFANEAFLRTAVDQRSVLELARLVGYVPSPGVAASAVLAFTLSSAPGSPDNVLIPAGSRVQSVPGPSQTAQVFQTSADLTAVIGWNALPAQTTIPWQLYGEDTSTWIAGTANNASPGDGLLFVQASGGQASPTGPAEFHYVTAVSVSPASDTTQIWWDTPLTTTFLGSGAGGTVGPDDVCLYVMGKKAALYGAQAPSPMTLSGTYIPNVPGYPGTTQVQWNYSGGYTYGSSQINLDASYPGLQPPASPGDGPPQWAVLTDPTLTVPTAVFAILAAAETSPNRYTLTAKTTQLTLALCSPPAAAYATLQTEADAIAEVVAAFGDAFGTATNSSPVALPTVIDVALSPFVTNTPNVTVYVQSAPLTPVGVPSTTWSLDPTGTLYPRRAGMLTPVAGTSVPLIGGQQIIAGQPIGVSGKCVRIQAQSGTFTPTGQSAASASAIPPTGQVFVTASFPPTTATAGTTSWTVTTLSGVPGVLSATATALQLLPSATTDPQAGEAAIVQSVAISGDIATLTLAAPLAAIYDAATVTVNANAVMAANGQTVQEILGSGDATNDALQFTLKQQPLTYLPAPSGNGTQSTLQVWVNNLQWHETANLLTAGPADRVFITSTNAAGNTIVQFGNGIQGARTPTGTANIRAVYCTGIGNAGMVSAGQLSLPLDRPQGLMSVTNPAAASGAADPASPDEARASAPLPTLTIGRVVSLQDYQNFALGFAGIAKALASWTWLGSTRGVFLTVAGVGGAALTADDPVVSGLIGAIGLCSDPHVPLVVAPYQPVLFTFTAAVGVDQADYAPGQVLAQVWQDVSAAFAFDQRQFGQGVTASQIIQIIQQVAGVTAVQLQTLTISGATPSTPPTQLCASGPQPPLGAQLLQLDPATQSTIGLWS